MENDPPSSNRSPVGGGIAARYIGNRDGQISRRLPCFEVAELFGDHLADVDAQPIDDPLRQVRVRRAAEHLDVGHSVVVDVRERRDQV